MGRGNPRLRVLLALVAAIALVVSIEGGSALAGDGGSATAAKKKCKKKGKKKKCKKKAPPLVSAPAPAPPPAPLALTEAEVTNRIVVRAGEECAIDPDCVDYGYYTDLGGNLDCDSRTTYTWVCYGWNDEDYDADPDIDETCDFREIVERVGYDGITSHQDLTFGTDGWDCYTP